MKGAFNQKKKPGEGPQGAREGVKGKEGINVFRRPKGAVLGGHPKLEGKRGSREKRTGRKKKSGKLAEKGGKGSARRGKRMRNSQEGKRGAVQGEIKKKKTTERRKGEVDPV